MATRLVLYEGVIQEYILEQARKLAEDAATAVHLGALVLVPIRSGALAESIHSEPPHIQGLKVSVQVGSELRYALYAHEGTRAHEQHARPGGVLYLGGKGFAESVHHPATTGTPFLAEPLRRVGARLNFIVTTGRF